MLPLLGLLAVLALAFAVLPHEPTPVASRTSLVTLPLTPIDTIADR